MKFCDECLRWGIHPAGCPNEPGPELTVCAGCSEEVEEVEICHGDVAPDGAACKAGLYYCGDCYSFNHVCHEDSDRGEEMRSAVKKLRTIKLTWMKDMIQFKTLERELRERAKHGPSASSQGTQDSGPGT